MNELTTFTFGILINDKYFYFCGMREKVNLRVHKPFILLQIKSLTKLLFELLF